MASPAIGMANDIAPQCIRQLTRPPGCDDLHAPLIAWPDLTMNKYKIKTSQFQTGDTCFKYHDNKMAEVFVKFITQKTGSIMTYNISRLEKNNSYFANGILVSSEAR